MPEAAPTEVRPARPRPADWHGTTRPNRCAPTPLLSRNMFRALVSSTRRPGVGDDLGTFEHVRTQEPETGPPDAPNEPFPFQLTEHAAGHLPARPDERREIRP